MIRVLLVDDSLAAQLHLKHILDEEPDMAVVAVAFNGEEAIATAARIKPDLILMDIQMPKMNGVEATQRIMSSAPVPIIIVTSGGDDAELGLRAVAVGALAVEAKPPSDAHPSYDLATIKLVQTIRQMAGVKVVRRWSLGTSSATAASATAPVPTPTPMPPETASAPPAVRTFAPEAGRAQRPTASSGLGKHQEIELVAIGASTGGPPVLKTIFEALSPSFPVPILVVQHIATGFLPGLVTWLASQTALPVHLAIQGDLPLPGHIYLAPDHFHMGVGADHRLILSPAPPERGLRPAVSFLFRSVAQIYGAKAAGVLLTGMGKDGAEELGTMHALGCPTIAQDQKTSVVHGMPGEAIRLGAATWALAPDDIAATLIRLTNKRLQG